MTILEEALKYAARGWSIFPLHGIVDGQCTCRLNECPDSGKHPVTRRGLKDASQDPDVIKLWFKEPYNIGLVTGQESGITVLDIDPRHQGDSTWAELIKDHGEPNTLIVKTGGGGLHVYFTYNSALKSSSNTLGQGVDCRNDGGYVVAPPSSHRSGNSYQWIDEEALILPLPAHLTKRKEKAKERKRGKKRYSLEEVKTMLEVIPADDRDLWRNVGIILGREFSRSQKAWDLYVEWSNKWTGQKGRNHDTIMNEAFHELSSQDGDLSIGTILKFALDNGWSPKKGSIGVENFIYYAEGNSFIYRPTGAFWIANAVDKCVGMLNHEGVLRKASEVVESGEQITSITSDPNMEEISKGWDSRDGIPIKSQGMLYNTYRPSNIELGKSEYAQKWVDHVKRIYPNPGDSDQFLDYMAHRVQNPGEKPRFALVIVGEQGVGKDTAISMAGPAIGEWNVANIDPKEVDSNFNEYASKVLVVVSEASNAQDMSKWSFNERMKVLIAGTPDYMRINPKFGHKFSARLHCGVLITTNHLNGLYIPNDDRRYDVIKAITQVELEGLVGPRPDYFKDFWSWYVHQGGASHIAAYLYERDISKFNAASGQRITAAHRQIVSGGFDNDEWLILAIEKLGDPAVVTFQNILDVLEADQNNKMSRSDVRIRIGHVMPRIGYIRLVNPETKDGRWKVNGSHSTVVYFKEQLITSINAIAWVKQGRIKKEAF